MSFYNVFFDVSCTAWLVTASSVIGTGTVGCLRRIFCYIWSACDAQLYLTTHWAFIFRPLILSDARIDIWLVKLLLKNNVRQLPIITYICIFITVHWLCCFSIPFHSIVLFQATRPIQTKQRLGKNTESVQRKRIEAQKTKHKKHAYTTRSDFTKALLLALQRQMLIFLRF